MQKLEADKVVREMLPHLNNKQLAKLREVLGRFISNTDLVTDISNDILLERYFSAKRAEGCS